MPPPRQISDTSSLPKGLSNALWSLSEEGDFKSEPCECFPNRRQLERKALLAYKIAEKLRPAYLSSGTEPTFWNFFFQKPVLRVRIPSLKGLVG